MGNSRKLRLGVQGHCFTQAARDCDSHSGKAGAGAWKTVLLRGAAAAAAELWNYLTSPRELFVLSYKDGIRVMKERESEARPPTSWADLECCRGSGHVGPTGQSCSRGWSPGGWWRLPGWGRPPGLPTSQGARGMVRAPLHSEPDQRFPDASEDIPRGQPYSRFWNLLPG